MNLKKLFFIIFSFTGAVLFSSAVFAGDITVKINGGEIYFEDKEPEIVNGRTLIPLRGVFDSMGFDVNWNESTRSAEISNSLNDIIMTENINRITANTKTIDIDVAPMIMEGRLMIPLRAVAESIDADVEWDENTRTVSIYYIKAEGIDESVNNVGMDEQEYIKTIISIKGEMRDITASMPDAVLEYAANIGNFSEAASFDVSEEQYDELIGVLDRLGSVNAPDSFFSADRDLKEYVKIIKELIDYSREKNPKNTVVKGKVNLTSDLDVYKMNIEELNSSFSNCLIKYFMDNEVYWESIYGENEIVNFLLY